MPQHGDGEELPGVKEVLGKLQIEKKNKVED
jgi:hypothetical protein